MYITLLLQFFFIFCLRSIMKYSSLFLRFVLVPLLALRQAHHCIQVLVPWFLGFGHSVACITLIFWLFFLFLLAMDTSCLLNGLSLLLLINYIFILLRSSQNSMRVREGKIMHSLQQPWPRMSSLTVSSGEPPHIVFVTVCPPGGWGLWHCQTSPEPVRNCTLISLLFGL